MRIAAIVMALAVSIVGVALFARAVASIVSVVKLGKPAADRGDHRGARWQHMLTETLGHTRMLQWTKVGAAHWFVFIAFGALFFTLITAYGQLFDPRFDWRHVVDIEFDDRLRARLYLRRKALRECVC